MAWRILLAVSLSWALISCGGKNNSGAPAPAAPGPTKTNPKPTPGPTPPPVQRTFGDVTIMNFNIENLFDTKDDPATDDKAYLPLAAKQTPEHIAACNTLRGFYKEECLKMDWSEDVLKVKMDNLAGAIRKVNGGRGPDIMVVEEVENQGILERFNKERLADLNYKSVVVIDGEDERGIDVGMMSRFPIVGSPILHPLRFEWNQRDRTRGILQVTFALPNGQPLTILGVHLPSQGQSALWRYHSLNELNRIARDLPRHHLIMAAGDFNMVQNEIIAFDQREISPFWVMSHLLCNNCPKGTIYYPPDRTWSWFDMILIGKDWAPNAGLGRWDLIPEKIRVENTFAEHVRDGAPNRFSWEHKTGVADHWPYAIDLKYSDR